jgi:hypothetical protein
MSKTLPPLDALLAMSAEERFELSLAELVQREALWTLAGPKGSLLFDQDEGPRLWPLWPSEELAQLHANGVWEDAEPQEIELRAFLDSWVTGLSKDGHYVTVCPMPDGESMVLTPEELGDELLAILMPES